MKSRGAALLACILWLVWPAASAFAGASVAQSEGEVTVTIDGEVSSAEQFLNQQLAAGTLISTSVQSRALLRLGDGLYFELQPETTVIIGETREGAIIDAVGNSLPQTQLMLNAGSFVVISSAKGLASQSVIIATPQGNITPVNAGEMLVATTTADPSSASVVVVSVTGDGVFTSSTGEPLPFGDGLAISIDPDGVPRATPLTDFSNQESFHSTVEASSLRLQDFLQFAAAAGPSPTPTANPTPSTAVSTSSAPSVLEDSESSPSSEPMVEPGPTTSPAPTSESLPSPTPSPSPTPKPTPTPSPSPSPTPTPKPTPTPSPTPKPTPTPSPSPTPTPKPTPTPQPSPPSP